MSITVAFQMDHPRTFNIEKDSTFVLGLEAQRRGHTLFYYDPATLKLRDGVVSASCASFTLRPEKENHYTLSDFKTTDLADFDLILMRQDFNDPLNYNAITHILDHLKGKTLVLNDPAGVRESPEKILITHYPEFAPPTLLTRDISEIREFQKEFKDVIIKPLNGFGGLDIYHLKDGDDNLQAVVEMFSRLHHEPFVVQKYLPEIRKGDKRIIVVEGEPVGALLRVPAAESARANLATGGSAVKTEITDREREICAALKPELIKRGLVFVGLDVIGDVVTEINPKSPTGLQHIYKLDGFKCEEPIWDAYEARLKQTGA